MIDPYIQQVLRVIVAQICQTIGWHSIQTTPLELLVDILHKYLLEITRNITRYTELYNRIEPNLNDVGLAFRELNINLHEIDEYVNYVQPIPCNIDIPKFPVPKGCSLNFLKPGSKEVLTRPMYIPEYLPPVYPEKEEEVLDKQLEMCDTTTDNVIEVNSNPNDSLSSNKINDTTNINNVNENNNNNTKFDKKNYENENETDENNTLIKESLGYISIENIISSSKTEKNLEINTSSLRSPIPGTLLSETAKQSVSIHSNPLSSLGVTSTTTSNTSSVELQSLSKFIKHRLPYHEGEGRPTREISSVIMTSSGFISPAREGKLPDCKIPVITEPRSARSPSPPKQNSKMIAGAKQLSQISSTTTTTATNAQSFKQVSKQDKKNILQQSNVSTTDQFIKSSKNNTNKAKNHAQQQMGDYDSKYIKKLKRKKLLELEKEQRKLEKLNKNVPVSKQLLLPKQQQKLLKQHQKQLLKLQKQQKQQQKLNAICKVSKVEDSHFTPSGALDPIITNSDIIMPTTETNVPLMLSDQKTISKLAKKHKGILRKKQELLMNMLQSKKKSKDGNRKLQFKEKNSPGSHSSEFNRSSHANYDAGGFDKQTLAILQHQHAKRKNSSVDSLSKSTPINAQSPNIVAQLAAVAPNNNNFKNDLLNKYNQSGTILPSTIVEGNVPLVTTLLAKQLQNYDEVKTNECEREKLSVFKKSSSKKEFKDSTNLNLDQFIHLPSGTTITPTLENITSSTTNSPINIQANLKSNITMKSKTGRDVKLPTDTDQIICIDDDDNSGINNKNKQNKNKNVTQSISVNSAVSSTNNETASLSKAEKKLKRKLQQNEPLNLSNSDKLQYSAALISATNIGSNANLNSTSLDNDNKLQEFYLEQQMRIQQQYAIATKMMKKERKKPKLKDKKMHLANLSQQQSSAAAAAVLAAAHQQYIQNLAAVTAATSNSRSSNNNSSSKDLVSPTSLSHSPNIRSTENLAAINKKLMKIDTVMQPAPPSTLSQNCTNMTLNPSPSCSITNNNPKQQKSNQSSISATANALASLSHFPYPPFPYAFPSRPGLIPTPAIYPPLSTAALVDKFLPMMPFSKFNPMKSTNSTLEEINKLTGHGNTPPNSNQQLGIDLEKNYCNVAPLVPECMIQNYKLSPTKKQNKHKSSTGSQKSVDLQQPITKQYSFNKFNTSTQNNIPISSNEAENNINDTTIEISDDEKIKSDSEEKISQSIIDQQSKFTDTETNILSSTISTNINDDIRKKNFNQVVFNNATSTSQQNNNLYNTGEYHNIDQIYNNPQNTETADDREIILHKHEKRKEHHKKNKKMKEGKVKKKKDKKDKSKSKDKSEKKKDKEERLKDKEKLKKQKKEKKKEKLRQLSIGSANSSSTSSALNTHDGITTIYGNKQKNKYENNSMITENDENSGVSSTNNDLVKSNTNDNINNDNLISSGNNVGVPKLTLILGGIGKSPTPDSLDNSRKFSIKSHEQNENNNDGSNITASSFPVVDQTNSYKKELSPELARISPLVTRPPKQKSKEKDKISDNELASSASVSLTTIASINQISHSTINVTSSSSALITPTATTPRGPGRPKGSGNKNLANSSNLNSIEKESNIFNQYQQIKGNIGTGFTTTNNLMPSSMGNPSRPTNLNSTDAEGNQVWICPACGRVDDGTPMIGCDGCDAWYHWVCVGIQVPPDDNEDWYCRVCIAKKQATQESDKKKKRKKKNKQVN